MSEQQLADQVRATDIGVFLTTTDIKEIERSNEERIMPENQENSHLPNQDTAT